MEYQDHLVNLLKHKLETIDTEHSIFHRVLDAVVKKVTDDVKAVIKIGEISYGKYKELSSSMEQVLNLLIQLSIEIQKPRDGVNSVNTDDIVEAVYSRLSSELTKKDKEINSMLSNQRKEIEENIQRTSDEWYQKYKELTTHLDNLEVEAQNNYKELSLEKSNSFEKHNNIMVQLKRENESMKRDILNVSERLQTLQDDWSSQNLNLSEVLTKNNEDTLNKNEEFNSRLSEIVSKVGSNERYMKEQFQYLDEKFTRLSELENQNDQLKMHLPELSDKYEGMRNCQVDKTETMKKSECKIGTEVQETEPQKEITIIELASEELEQLKSKLDSNIQKVNITALPNSKVKTKNNWVPRKEQAGPKKIDEVHKDFQQEQFTKQLMQSQPPPPRNDNAQPNSRRRSRQRQEEIRQLLDDGWNFAGSKSLRIDASKKRRSKNVVDENSIQLGPGGGTNKFSMWSRGSYGGAQPSTDDRPAPATNRFSLLRGEEDRRNFQRSPSRGDNVSKSTIIGGKIVEM